MDKNFLIRRARLIFQGDVAKRLSFWIQSDLVKSAGTTGNVAQLRDAYGVTYLTTDRVHRFRNGQSKKPYGWENMQSGSNRLALDRADALNSAVRDERDLGVFYYQCRSPCRTASTTSTRQGLCHSGNYGLFGLSVYNGQGANCGHRNDNQHVSGCARCILRSSRMGSISGPVFRVIAAKSVLTTGANGARGDGRRTPTTAAADGYRFLDDERVAVSAIWYPQLFGLQGAEWNWGTHLPAPDRSPTASSTAISMAVTSRAMGRFENRYGKFLPFVKWQYFDGGNKAETNAAVIDVDELGARSGMADRHGS